MTTARTCLQICKMRIWGGIEVSLQMVSLKETLSPTHQDFRQWLELLLSELLLLQVTKLSTNIFLRGGCGPIRSTLATMGTGLVSSPFARCFTLPMVSRKFSYGVFVERIEVVMAKAPELQ